MMLRVLISLGLLGLAAVDPIGIAAMPVLLIQKHPLKRSFTFLAGSFASLMLMGILFAHGFGAIILRFENTYSWLVPGFEVLAGVILLGVAAVLLWRLKRGRLSVEPPDSMLKKLKLGSLQLFLFGAALVALQSMVDVVFVIAMIQVGKLHLPNVTVFAAVAVYATAALTLQLAVVVAYLFTSPKHRFETLERIHGLLQKYANQAMIGAGFLLGCALIAVAALQK